MLLNLSNLNILKTGQMTEQLGDLKTFAQPLICYFIGWNPGNLFSLKKYPALIGAGAVYNQIHKRGLSGAVGSDDCMYFSPVNIQTHVISRFQCSEIPDQMLCPQNNILCHNPLLLTPLGMFWLSSFPSASRGLIWKEGLHA